MRMSYEFFDSEYEEQVKVSYQKKSVFQGYTDDLVTSISGDLELRLNYNSQNISPVIARKFNSELIWLPKPPDCYTSSYCYQLMSFSINEFEKLWNSLRYDPAKDYEFIKAVDFNEFKLAWLLSSNCKEDAINIEELVRGIYRKILTINSDKSIYKEILQKLLFNSWNSLSLGNEILIVGEKWERISVIIDNDDQFIEWDILMADENNKTYIHLGNKFCIQLLNV